MGCPNLSLLFSPLPVKTLQMDSYFRLTSRLPLKLSKVDLSAQPPPCHIVKATLNHPGLLHDFGDLYLCFLSLMRDEKNGATLCLV